MIARAVEAEAAEQNSESDPEESLLDVEELLKATTTTTKIWHLRLRSLERWFPTPRLTKDASLFWTDLQQRFHLAYSASRMTLFTRRVLVPSLLTRAIDMTREQIKELFSY